MRRGPSVGWRAVLGREGILPMDILNICPDDKISADKVGFYRRFSPAGVHHRFVTFSRRADALSCLADASGVEFSTPERELARLAAHPVDAVFVHCLAEPGNVGFVARIPPGVKLFWFAWGYDVYADRLFRRVDFKTLGWRLPLLPSVTLPPVVEGEWLGPLTRGAFFSLPLRARLWVKSALQRTLFRPWVAFARKAYGDVLRRVDYFSGVFPLEHDFVARNPCVRAAPVRYRNTCLEAVQWGNVDAPVCLGDDVRVGNSGDAWNNHVDLFRSMARLDFRGRHVRVPLTYGGTDGYRRKVVASGRAAFGEAFVPIEGYLPHGQYLAEMDLCAWLVMGAVRQHGVINIEDALWKGMKVFMPRGSMGFRHFRALGCAVFSVEDDLSDAALRSRLPFADVRRNREALRRGRFTPQDCAAMLADLYALIP